MYFEGVGDKNRARTSCDDSAAARGHCLQRLGFGALLGRDLHRLGGVRNLKSLIFFEF